MTFESFTFFGPPNELRDAITERVLNMPDIAGEPRVEIEVDIKVEPLAKLPELPPLELASALDNFGPLTGKYEPGPDPGHITQAKPVTRQEFDELSSFIGSLATVIERNEQDIQRQTEAVEGVKNDLQIFAQAVNRHEVMIAKLTKRIDYIREYTAQLEKGWGASNEHNPV